MESNAFERKWRPVAPHTIGLTSEILQKIKLIFGKNVAPSSLRLCYRYFLLNQKKRRCEIYISKISGSGMKKRNGIEMALPIFCSAW